MCKTDPYAAVNRVHRQLVDTPLDEPATRNHFRNSVRDRLVDDEPSKACVISVGTVLGVMFGMALLYLVIFAVGAVG